MLRTIWWFIYFWMYAVISLPTLWKVRKLQSQGKHTEAEHIIFQFLQTWAKSLIRQTGSTIHVTGTEHIPISEPVLFVSNHQGNFDIPILLGYLPRAKGFIAKKELKRMPIIGSWMKVIGCVFLDRKDIKQSLRSIQQGVSHLQEGLPMVVFPEGTRSKGRPLAPFKPGSLKLASKAKVPIVPVTIKGSYQLLEQRGMIYPAQVDVIISPPIHVEEINGGEMNHLAERLEKQIAAHL